jgi:hypothetical protein
VPLLVPGLLGVLLCLHLYNGLAWLYGLAARIMLGPSTVELRERVDDLREARARIIEAADAERRRIERDLHDGAQQRLGWPARPPRALDEQRPGGGPSDCRRRSRRPPTSPPRRR